jgi:hypothetical protein
MYDNTEQLLVDVFIITWVKVFYNRKLGTDLCKIRFNKKSCDSVPSESAFVVTRYCITGNRCWL